MIIDVLAGVWVGHEATDGLGRHHPQQPVDALLQEAGHVAVRLACADTAAIQAQVARQLGEL